MFLLEIRNNKNNQKCMWSIYESLKIFNTFKNIIESEKFLSNILKFY